MSNCDIDKTQAATIQRLLGVLLGQLADSYVESSAEDVIHALAGLVSGSFQYSHLKPWFPSHFNAPEHIPNFSVGGRTFPYPVVSDVEPSATAELELVELALAARWLSVRAEGTAKVAEADRARFCFANLSGPLQWLKEHWCEVVDKVRG